MILYALVLVLTIAALAELGRRRRLPTRDPEWDAECREFGCHDAE